MSGWAALAQGAASIADKGFGLWAGEYSAKRAWARQKEAMQNAHQWEVADLRKAGLNPILSATGGSGASGVSVPMADYNQGDGFSRGVDRATQAILRDAQTDSAVATAKNLEEQNKNLAATNKILQSNALEAAANAKIAHEKSIQEIKRTNVLTDKSGGFDLMRAQEYSKINNPFGLGYAGFSSAKNYGGELLKNMKYSGGTD